MYQRIKKIYGTTIYHYIKELLFYIINILYILKITYTNPKKKYKLKGSFRVMWASEVANNEQTVLVQIDQTTKYLEINTQYCKLLQSIKKNAENIIESMNETENMEEALTHIKKGYDIIKKECDLLNL